MLRIFKQTTFCKSETQVCISELENHFAKMTKNDKKKMTKIKI